jgi:hypothetical protein
MRLPSALVGSEPDVAARAGDLARVVEAGTPLAEAVREDADGGGLVVLQGGSPLIRDADAYRAAALHERLDAADPRLFEQTLLVPWGVLALLGQDTQAWVMPEDRHEPFLRAALGHAPQIGTLDGRFTIGQTTGSALWDLPNNLRFVLARRGVDREKLIDPAPGGGWEALVREALG